ncbi:PecA family PE domain-processing aspartic protease, partial [Mycobacterium montefiorense]|uniref:PecA family PE domain-processing aspartic protease n=1 Tax=Mycobacterium montefiorense TaxID=154654 RepID=UPI0021C475BD
GIGGNGGTGGYCDVIAGAGGPGGAAGLLGTGGTGGAGGLWWGNGSSSIEFGQAPQFETNYYDVYRVPVDFGNGIITRPTNIGVVSSATMTNTVTGVTTPIEPSMVEPIVGIGAITGTPPYFTTSPTQALPGILGNGMLIDEPRNCGQFGPNPLSGTASMLGAAGTKVNVSINGGQPQAVPAIVDTGGRYGYLPSDLIGNIPVGAKVPAGTIISVTALDGTPLYTQTVNDSAGPTVTTPTTADGIYNTGYFPFSLGRIYFGYDPPGVGITTFDVPAVAKPEILAAKIHNAQTELLDVAV